MKDYSELISRVEEAGNEIFWLGAASSDQIEALEKNLGCVLPESFKDFLSIYGGGGVVDAEISGIEDNDASIDFGGTVYGDTLTAREEYDLPKGLVVIFFRDDETCWCIDSRDALNSKEFPVVSYNLFKKKVDKKISDDFSIFFEEYFTLRSR
tara:strand:- start:172 stop:630 length:459 start_codon:yes stop_codon:yes gene_type:complete